MSDPRPPPDRSPVEVPPAETPGLQGLLTLAVAVVVVAALYLAREVMIPVILAVLLSFLLAPLVNQLRRLHLGRVPSVLLAVVLALGIILAFGTVIGGQLAELAPDVPRYATAVQQKLDAAQQMVLGHVGTVLRRISHQFDSGEAAKTPPEPGTTAPAAQAGPEQKATPVVIREPEPSMVQLVERIIAPVVAPLLSATIVFIVSIFILLQREDLRDRLIRLFGSRDLHRTTIAMNDAARRLSRYFLTQLAINASFGVIIGTGLFFIGVPNPVLWGMLAVLLRFVPYIGAPLAGLVPVVLAAAVDPGWSMVLYTAALYAGVEIIMGQVVEPLLYAHSTGLSPFAVVVSAAFWTWLWGPIGLILSTPLTLCLVVLGRHVERLEFLDIILGDRPPLTPTESFYQRILAGDPDEARAQAELLLKEGPLSLYYDNVAMKGLRLAEADMARGVLTAGRVERINESIRSLIEDLDEYDEPVPTDTPAGRNAMPVMCLAGRGPFDEAASLMLAQLLRKQGLAARVVPYQAVSRPAIGSLEANGTPMVCLCYVELNGTPSHLRYLIRRLRQRMPDTSILVGFWPSEEAILSDPQLRAVIGADYYSGSLQEAVETCLEAVEKANPVETQHTPEPATASPGSRSASG